jgi:hypothetical protein
MLETDEFVAGNSEGIKMDLVYFTTAYQKMKSLCHNLRNEIFTDIEIHNHHILPRYFDVSGPDVHFLDTVLRIIRCKMILVTFALFPRQ